MNADLAIVEPVEANTDLSGRMCIVTRDVLPEEQLVRFVRSPDGRATPDLARRLPGRGVWVTCKRSKIEHAATKGLFARGFGEATIMDPALPDLVARLLRERARASLSFARKAGEALQGFTKVDEALRKGPIGIILHAKEAAVDGCRKIDRLAQPKTFITTLPQADLDLAFGRENVVHVCVAEGGLCQKLHLDLTRLSAYDTD